MRSSKTRGRTTPLFRLWPTSSQANAIHPFYCLAVHYRRDIPDTVGKSRFTFLPSKADIYNGRCKTQDAEDSFSFAIQCLESCVLCLESNKSDYSHYLVWIAKPFNTNVLQHFHQKIMITYITYTILIHYYMHYLTEKSKVRKLRTGNRKLKQMITSTSQFHQVTPFSLFYCPSIAP